MPKWVREILISVSVATRAISVFAVAVAAGTLAAIKIGEGNPWVAAATATGVLLFVVLPVRLWWPTKRSRGYPPLSYWVRKTGR